eukprot:COSAG02_NODE_9588_length_2169_cov_0.982126_1_plen_699_part_10
MLMLVFDTSPWQSTAVTIGYTSFEDVITMGCSPPVYMEVPTASTCEPYIDTLGHENAHALVNNPNQNPVVHLGCSGGTELGFLSYWSPVEMIHYYDGEGLTNTELTQIGGGIGVIGDTTTVMAGGASFRSGQGGAAPHGTQYYVLNSVKGFVYVKMDPVRVVDYTDVQMSAQVRVKDTSYEVTDRIVVWASEDSNVATTVEDAVLLDANHRDDMPRNTWRQYTADLSGFANAAMHFGFQSDSTAEAAWFDYFRIEGTGPDRSSQLCGAGPCSAGTHASGYLAGMSTIEVLDAVTCMPCPVGKQDHDSDPGTPCLDCVAGQYSSSPGTIGACQSCPTGRYSDTGSPCYDTLVQGSGASVSVDCVGSWSICTAACEKVFTIFVQHVGDGARCPSSNGDKFPCFDGDCEPAQTFELPADLPPVDSHVPFVAPSVDSTSYGAIMAQAKRASHVAIADLSCDGLADIFIVNHGSAENDYYVNDGSGVFSRVGTSLIVQKPSAAGDPTASLTVGDINGDGFLDVVMPGGGGAQVGEANRDQVFINDGSGGFTVLNTGCSDSLSDLNGFQRYDDRRTWRGCGYSNKYEISDLDGDGYMDLLVLSYGMENTILRNNANNGFIRSMVPQSRNGWPDGERAVGACVEDLDGDGDNDMFIARWLASNQLLRNNGNLQFEDSRGGSPSGELRFGGRQPFLPPCLKTWSVQT